MKTTTTTFLLFFALCAILCSCEATKSRKHYGSVECYKFKAGR